jgi:hypothetical protein
MGRCGDVREEASSERQREEAASGGWREKGENEKKP